MSLRAQYECLILGTPELVQNALASCKMQWLGGVSGLEWPADLGPDLRTCFMELLRQPDYQKRRKNSRDQAKICMGEYLFVNPGCCIRNVSGECMGNGRFKKKAKPYHYENRYAAQAGRSPESWSGGAQMSGTKVEPKVKGYADQNHRHGAVGILPVLYHHSGERYGKKDQQKSEY